MISFYLYDTSTGRVLATGQYDERSDGASARAFAFGVIDPPSQYVPGGVKTARTPPPDLQIDKTVVIGNGADAVTISAVPNPASVTVTKKGAALPCATANVTDGLAVMDFATPGIYVICVRAFPYQDATYIVEATP